MKQTSECVPATWNAFEQHRQADPLTGWDLHPSENKPKSQHEIVCIIPKEQSIRTNFFI